ncbi:MAG: ABC transporter ATP-binding protein [Rhodospirillales bacterium]|nr:ABC transporter ATP-binding protein [Rhodospirillales bacterium]
MLTVEGVSAGYGDVPVLHGVSLTVDAGEVVALVGANGAGKSTLLLTIGGHLPVRGGAMRFAGADITRARAHHTVARGLVMVPEGGRLFPFMTVRENLLLGAYHAKARRRMAESLGEMLDLFPFLRERRDQMAGRLSGGERQMVAIARAMMSLPRLLMLDEPSLGLSPLMVERIFEMVQGLAMRKGITVLLVEQNVGEALAMSRRGYVLERGRIVKAGEGAALRDDVEVQHAYMGL